MADDPVLKMFEIQAELEKLKEESTQIQNQNNELKNQLVVNNLIRTVNEFQTNISTRVQTIQENLSVVSENMVSLSTRVLNHDQILSEISETLRKINENLNKQNESIRILKANVETETILLLGGYDGKNQLDTLLILENRASWKELNIKLPYPVYSHGAQFLNNSLYIFGGYKDKEGAINFTYKLSKSLQWKKMADMNQKRQYISNSSVLLNNQIWVCGGHNEKYEILKSVEMYDPVTNKWKYMKRNAAAAVVNGKIFCSGGFFERSVECYDSSSDVWTIISILPQNMCAYGAVEMDENLIIVGECDDYESLNYVWALNTTDENSEWIEKPSISTSREWFIIAKIDGKIFVCGGQVRIFSITDSVEIFDGEVWRNGPKMPTPRSSAPAVVIPMEFAIYLK